MSQTEAVYGADAIAIVGLSGRFPGARDLGELWQLLLDGSEGLTHLDESDLERAGVSDAVYRKDGYVPVCGAVHGFDCFDSDFFRITRAEAERTDPQQRLFLQHAYLALEQAGYARRREDFTVGVFCGASLSTYLLENLLAAVDRTVATTIMGTFVGNDKDYLATNVAYRLDLRGPAVTVQTACSTSLVAVHIAAQSLLAHECDLALAGGVTVRVPHHVGYLYQSGGVMSGDGHTRPFDARGTGTIFGNGVGAFSLRRLGDALEAGDPIRAVLVGSAINNDGARKVGFVAPSLDGQVGVVAEALGVAGLEPDDVDIVEAHGTGTYIGDAIEARALARVFDTPTRRSSRLLLGSVKSNLGHLETAAGAAALAKTVLALEHGIVPASINVRTPIDELADTPSLELVTKARPWPERGRLRCAGISSFGIGGTNAHLILASAPSTSDVGRGVAPSPVALDLSAQTSASLAMLCGDVAQWLSHHSDTPFPLLRASLKRGRPHLDRRLAVAGEDQAALRDALAAHVRGEPHPGVAVGEGTSDEPRRLGFLFAGQGTRLAGAASALYEAMPKFREEIDAADALLAKAGVPVREILVGGVREPVEPGVVQPVSVALQLAVARIWREDLGAVPDVVVGHSIGEIAAAVAAGWFERDAALSFAARRGRSMEELCPEGAMLAVLGDADTVESIAPENVEVAARNGRDGLVLAGSPAAIESTRRRLDGQGLRCVMLPVSRAYHSRQIEASLEAVGKAATELRSSIGCAKIISTVLGAEIDPSELVQPEYWRRHARSPVLLARALHVAGELAVTEWVDMGPEPQLADYVKAAIPSAEVVSGLGGADRSWPAILAAGARLRVRGAQLRPWRDDDRGGPALVAPGYRFDEKRHWVEPATRATSPHQAERLEINIGPTLQPYLRDHRVAGRMLAPGALFAELALAYAEQQFGPGASVEDLRFRRPVLLVEGQQSGLVLNIVREGGQARFSVDVIVEDSVLNVASAVLSTGDPSASASFTYPAENARRVDGDELYRSLSIAGLGYGETFRGIETLHHLDGEAWARVAVPVSLAGEIEHYRLHPAVLDACLQVAIGVFLEHGSIANASYLPAGIKRLRAFAALTSNATLEVQARWRSGAPGADRYEVDIHVQQADQTIAIIDGLTLERVTGKASGDGGLPPSWLQARFYAASGTGEERDVSLVLSTARDALAQRVCGHLSTPVARYTLEGSDPDATALLGQLRPLSNEAGVPHLVLVVPSARPTGLATASDVWDVCSIVLHVVTSAASELPKASVDIVTRAALRVSDETRCPVHAAVWSMAGALASEYATRLQLRMIDLPSEATLAEADLQVLAHTVARSLKENRCVIRGGELKVQRLAVVEPDPVSQDPKPTARLECDFPGDLEELCFRTIALPEPGPGQVRVRVSAASLNFLDVLAALGQRPDLPEGPTTALGSECAGTIDEVGPGVQGLNAGMRVSALVGGAMATHVLVPIAHVHPLSTLDDVQAASFAVAFGTALHALDEVAHLQANETVLVHSASGGFGLAAVEVARHVGARVIATAGTEAKRTFLHERGIEHVFDSRSDEFVEQCLQVTEQRGADVVLNTLAGRLLPASLRALAPYGRMVDITKRDIYEHGNLDLSPFRRNLTYSAVDFSHMYTERPGVVRALVRTTLERLEGGEYAALPVEVFSADKAGDAFRRMAGAQHIGKLVLSLGTPALNRPRRMAAIRPDRSYLVTGGLGALGKETARRLVQLGCRHLILLGRRAPDTGTRQQLEILSLLGCQAYLVSADVADGPTLREALSPVLASAPPLDGVFHLAGVVDDRAAESIDEDDFLATVRPKLDGLRNLVAFIEPSSLSHFVVFSSVSAHFAPPGQGAYAAANGAMEALASMLGVRCIAWGGWGGDGMAVRAGTSLLGSALGLPPMPPALALDAFGSALVDRKRDLTVLAYQPADLARGGGRLAASPLVADIARAPAPSTGDESLLAALRAADPPQRVSLLADLLCEVLAGILSIDASQIDRQQNFSGFGLESLTTLELATRVERRLGQPLDPTLLAANPTIDELARALFSRVAIAGDGEFRPLQLQAGEPAELPQRDKNRAEPTQDELTELSLQDFGR